MNCSTFELYFHSIIARKAELLARRNAGSEMPDDNISLHCGRTHSYGWFSRKARHKTAPLEARGGGSSARARVMEVIELADDDVLDVMRSRACEQEVLDLLDEQPPTR